MDDQLGRTRLPYSDDTSLIFTKIFLKRDLLSVYSLVTGDLLLERCEECYEEGGNVE